MRTLERLSDLKQRCCVPYLKLREPRYQPPVHRTCVISPCRFQLGVSECLFSGYLRLGSQHPTLFLQLSVNYLVIRCSNDSKAQECVLALIVRNTFFTSFLTRGAIDPPLLRSAGATTGWHTLYNICSESQSAVRCFALLCFAARARRSSRVAAPVDRSDVDRLGAIR